MVLRLERLPLNIPIADKNGRPQTAFSRWWDQALTQIEDNLNHVTNAADAADAAQAAADAAQASADAAQAAADAAQAAADAANAAIAALGTAAHADTGTSGHTLPFCDGANTLADITATHLRLPALVDAISDADAGIAGVAIGEVYRKGSDMRVRES